VSIHLRGNKIKSEKRILYLLFLSESDSLNTLLSALEKIGYHCDQSKDYAVDDVAIKQYCEFVNSRKESPERSMRLNELTKQTGRVEVGICSTAGDDWNSEAILNLIGNFISIENLVLEGNVKEVIEGGSIFFSRDVLNKEIFCSNNSKLLDSLYLPTQLAKDGRGVFFEERIIDRLLELGFLGKDDHVDKIFDLGGWETIDCLCAKLDVKLSRNNGVDLTKRLHATALVPMPPLRPEELTRVIQQRVSLLKLLGVKTSVLEARDGIVYETYMPYSIGEALAAFPSMQEKLFEQLANMSAFVDSRALEMVTLNLNDTSQTEFSDIIFISDLGELENELNPMLSDFVRTDGETVFITDLSRSLRSAKDNSHFFASLIKNCPKPLIHAISRAYKVALQRYEDADWIRNKLIG